MAVRLSQMAVLVITTILTHQVFGAGTEDADYTLLGQGAGANVAAGATHNTLIGVNAGNALTIADHNTFVGASSGLNNTSGERNTFIGQDAGINNLTGLSNTFIGENSGYFNTDGSFGVFVGQGAGDSNTTGEGNTFVGRGTGGANTTGFHNSFFGIGTGIANTTGYLNTFVGKNAGEANTTGNNNTLIGVGSGSSITTGDWNTFIGRSTGTSIVSGSSNVFIGTYAGQGETGSNKLSISNNTTGTPLIYGEFDHRILGINGILGVGTEIPDAPLHVRRSDGSAKILVEEKRNVAAPRTLFELVNKGNTKFAMNNTDAGVTWAFANSGFDFRISRQGSGVVEMAVDNSGNLEVSGTSMATNHVNTSSRALKHSFQEVDEMDILERVSNLPISSWEYNKADSGGRHIGPVAEDFQSMFGLGDGRHISTVDTAGITLAAIQGLQAEKDRQIAQLKMEKDKQIQEVKAELSELKIQVEKLLASGAVVAK